MIRFAAVALLMAVSLAITPTTASAAAEPTLQELLANVQKFPQRLETCIAESKAQLTKKRAILEQGRENLKKSQDLLAELEKSKPGLERSIITAFSPDAQAVQKKLAETQALYAEAKEAVRENQDSLTELEQNIREDERQLARMEAERIPVRQATDLATEMVALGQKMRAGTASKSEVIEFEALLTLFEEIVAKIDKEP